jgi:hypothetical protein
MGLINGQTIDQSDFINKSQANPTPSADVNRVPKLETDGKLSNSFLRTGFGGDGTDGILAISSGTTTIDCAGAAFVEKNYMSVAITGSAKLAFINPHANGTIISIKSRGDVTLTSSTVPCVDVSGMGATGGAGGAPGTGSDGLPPTGRWINYDETTVNGKGSGAGGTQQTQNIYTFSADSIKLRKTISITCGAGGAGGAQGSISGGTGAYGTAGARGGGALIIECAGALNFTGTVSTSGAAAINNPGTPTSGNAGGGAGAGGSAGMCLIIYNILTVNTGTISATGGNGGNGGAGTGTNNSAGNGGGGGGTIVAAGGAGGASSGSAGAAGAAGSGAGGGGGAGLDGSGAGGAGGAGGTSMGGIVFKNTIWA